MADDDLLLQLVADLKALKDQTGADVAELELVIVRGIEALRQELAGEQHEREGLSKALGDVATSVEELRKILDSASAEFLTAPWWWPRMTAEEARKAWDIICPWVDELIARYDPRVNAGGLPSGSRLRCCWFAHADVLDALSGLHWAWLGAYKSKASWISPIEWQERWLRQTLEVAEKAQRECAGGCSELDNKKTNDITTLDRDAYIARNVGSSDRPSGPPKDAKPQA